MGVGATRFVTAAQSSGLEASGGGAGVRGAASRRDCDPELQQIVESVHAELGFPMAMVSLSGRRTLCRAHVGLPGSFGSVAATARALSFCRQIVTGGRPLEVADAVGDAHLPQDLVREYGIGAYFGLPLTVCGHVLGSLCAIDTRPRRVTKDERCRLRQLAARAAVRLVEIEPRSLRTEHMIAHAVYPAFLEIRNLLNVLLGDVSLLGLALGDVRAVLDIVRNADGLLSRDGRDRAFEVLREALASNQDLGVTHERLETTSGKLTRYLLALQASLAAGEDSIELAAALEQADLVARHVTRNIGGVRWPVERGDSYVLGSNIATVAGVAAALRILAEGLAGGSSRGIDCRVVAERDATTVCLSAPDATEGLYRETCVALRAYLHGGAGPSVAATAAQVSISFARQHRSAARGS